MTTPKARPTTYKGIRMRSRLEADYAADLDRQCCRWEYEPECFAGPGGQWLPDFGSTFAAVGPLVIFDEVKPVEPLMDLLDSPQFFDHVDAIIGRMTVAWASRPDAMLRLVLWQYGGEHPYLSVFSRRQGELWFAEFGLQPFALLWAGMGQAQRCRDAAS